MRLKPHERVPGAWDYYGDCAPDRYGMDQFCTVTWETFSLGCFQWIAKANGKGVKRGKVQRRFKGYTGDPAPTFTEAETYCAMRELMEKQPPT